MVAREDSSAARRRRDSARDRAKEQDRARETAENKHTSARLRGDTVQKKKTEVTARENRPTREGEGPEPQAETKSEVPEGPEGPKVANKPEFAERCVSRFPG